MAKAIESRRSVRKFLPREIPAEFCNQILEAGRWAPSGLNNQPWRFVLVEDELLRRRIAPLTKYAKVIEQAPLLIVVLLDSEAIYNREKDIQGIGAAIQNMLLQVHSLELGAVWLGEILKNGSQVVELLELPPRYELMAVLAVGYPAEGSHGKAERKPLSELLLKRC